MFCSFCLEDLNKSLPRKPLEPGTILYHYRIISLIKQGDMGPVYKAVDYNKDCICTLIAIPEIYFEMGYHDLPGTIDQFPEHRDYYMVINYVEGEDPEEFMDRNKWFPFSIIDKKETPIAPEMILIPGEIENNDPDNSAAINSFYIGKYPVTNKEYKPFSNHTHKKNPNGPDYPVVKIRMYDMIEYCNWLSSQENLDLCYSLSKDRNHIIMDRSKNGYRLPTGAEWEYACRIASTTDCPQENNTDINAATLNNLSEDFWKEPKNLEDTSKDFSGEFCFEEYEIDKKYGWADMKEEDLYVPAKTPEKKIQPVGQKKTNSLGLYDMSGNILELCWDSNKTDKHGRHIIDTPKKIYGNFKTGILPGSSWKSDKKYLYKSKSNYIEVEVYSCEDDVGFRLVRKA